MKHRGTICAAIAAAALLTGQPPAAQADATSAARAAVQAGYNKEASAFQRKDFNALFALYTPDYTNTSEGGKTSTLAEMKQQVASFRMIKSIMPKATITKFALKGNTAVCTVKEHVILKANGPNGKPATLVIDDISDDVWVKGAKGWLKKSSKSSHTKQSQM